MAGEGDVLKESDHMREMVAASLTVVGIVRPTPHLVRISGRINASNLSQWVAPNLAIRLALPNPDGGKPFSRIYTVRSFDTATNIAEVDFVWHDHQSPAMNWLRTLSVGDAVSITGPRPHFLPNFASGRHCLMYADETALPAVYSILQQWPQGATADIYVETNDAEAFAELPATEGVTTHLLLRAAGQTGLLVEAARARGDLSNCTTWAAGERDDARALRKHFVEAGPTREDVQIYGYWKRDVTSTEIDVHRLNAYEALRARGDTLEELDDLDLAV